MSSFLYLRGLKHADFTVFGVQEGQKTFYDPQFNKYLPYSSGQQVKRSIMELFIDELGVSPAPTTFFSNVTVKNGKPSLGEGEVLSLCDPSFPDQLVGGYMRAEGGGGTKTIKRRSPLSISAMRPLHPKLAYTHNEGVSFDRSDRPEAHKVVVRAADGRQMEDDEIVALLKGSDRSLYRKWIPMDKNKRAGGLFVYDVAVDLRRLLTVQTNQFEPEVSTETITKLRSVGWTEGETVFGKCLVAPLAERKKIVKALAYALLNWQITSNQARTFSLMETLAVAISDNASKVAGAIRAKLKEDSDRVDPIIDDSISGVSTFVSLAASGYIHTNLEAVDALERAENELAKRIAIYVEAL